MKNAHVLKVAVVTMVLCTVVLGATTTPYETVFFKFPIISIDRLGVQTDAQITDLVNALEAATADQDVLEYRILMKVADQDASPVSPFDYWVEIWYNGAAAFLNRHKVLVPSYLGVSLQYMKTTGIGGCKLCPSSSAYVGIDMKTARHGYFINSQSVGAYPIQATYQAALPLSAAEPGTLDYVLTIPLTKISTEELLFDFTFVTFFELYASASAFGRHVVNNNVTLEVKGAANWFVDLGNTNTTWFALKAHSKKGACSRCDSPDTQFWNGPYTNPEAQLQQCSGNNKNGYIAAVVIETLVIVVLLCIVYFLYRKVESTGSNGNDKHDELSEQFFPT